MKHVKSMIWGVLTYLVAFFLNEVAYAVAGWDALSTPQTLVSGGLFASAAFIAVHIDRHYCPED